MKSWNGLVLRKPIDMEKRELVQRQEATLLDLRSYLFSRQCTLLLFLQRPWEVAQRALQLLHSCVQELRLLEVSMAGPRESVLSLLSCPLLPGCPTLPGLSAAALLPLVLFSLARFFLCTHGSTVVVDIVWPGHISLVPCQVYLVKSPAFSLSQ